MGFKLSRDAGSPVQKFFPAVLGTAISTPNKAFVIPDQFIGLELEIENVRGRPFERNGAINGWQIKGDGSLRGGNAFEFVSRGPQAPGELIPNVEHLIELLTSEGNTIKQCASFRTSIHVHMDFSRIQKYEDIPSDSIHGAQCTALLYYALEDQFFHVAGHERRHLGFSFPFDTALHNFASFLNNPAAAVGGAKYFGLNFNSLARFGTLEFRHLPLTFNIKRIFSWVDLLCRLKRWAYLNVRQDTGSPYVDLFKQPEVVGEAAEYIFAGFPSVIGTLDLDRIKQRLTKLDHMVLLSEIDGEPLSKNILLALKTKGANAPESPKVAKSKKIAPLVDRTRVPTFEELDQMFGANRTQVALNEQAVAAMRMRENRIRERLAEADRAEARLQDLNEPEF